MKTIFLLSITLAFHRATMASPTANEAAVYEAVRAIVAPMLLDRIVSQPTTSTAIISGNKSQKPWQLSKQQAGADEMDISLSCSLTLSIEVSRAN